MLNIFNYYNYLYIYLTYINTYINIDIYVKYIHK